MNQFYNRFQFYTKRRSVKYGIPFLLLVIGGSFGLKEFTQLRYGKSPMLGYATIYFAIRGHFPICCYVHDCCTRYQYSRNKTIKPEEVEEFGIHMKQPGEVTLETEFEKVKILDIDHWEQKRGPRPWEE